MFYVARGSVPHKRHTQHRARNKRLYAEELFGVEGFTGRSSLLYHLVPPTQTHKVEPLRKVVVEEADVDRAPDPGDVDRGEPVRLVGDLDDPTGNCQAHPASLPPTPLVPARQAIDALPFR